MRAPVLLLDEPLASLDPLARREFLHVLVDAVRADGSTALLSSHVITDIEQACDRLLVLGGGRTCCSTCRSPGRSPSIPWSRTVGPGGTVPPISGTRRRRLPGPAGERLSLVRGDGAGGRPATLEEVVLGHLAAARTPATDGRRRGARGMNADWVRLTLRLTASSSFAFGGFVALFIVASFAVAAYIDAVRPPAECLVNFEAPCRSAAT